MPSRGTTPPALRAVLAALWLASCRGNTSDAQRPGCDNGKLHLQRDLPEDGDRDCPESAWPDAAWKHPATNRVYDPEPARQVCMDKSIFYKHAIPNSGAYRPVMAESGEYVYCPPQRWLNNLHHGATVVLHHPCVPVRERVFLSALARSCLTHYVLTSHPQLNAPVALVSWGRTLELSTLASPDVCDWLEAATSVRKTSAGASGSRKYNLLLTRSSEEHGQRRGDGPSAKMETARQCCQKIVSSFLVAKEEDLRSNVRRKRRRDRRDIRAAFADGQSDAKSESLTENHKQTVSVPTLNTSALPDVVGSRQADSQDLSPGATGVLGSNISKAGRGQALPLAAEHLRPGDELDHTDPEAPSLSAGVNRRSDNGDIQEGHANEEAAENANDEEGDVEHERAHRIGSEPAFQHRLQTGRDCDGCRTAGRCECDRDPVARAGPPLVKKGFPKSPRTDEAVWAAAALGSLLVLLALAVLHTRLYRHWRTTPSLYWYDPQQDYESVADVIRRRLRISKRRSKRSRRQQCVLLPVSSSSDEH